MHRSLRVLATAAIAGVVLLSPTDAFAKGGAGGGTTAGGSNNVPVSYETTCVHEVTDLGNPYPFWYDLTNDRFPGSVSPLINLNANGVPITNQVCLTPGWTVTSTPVSNGINLRFFYANEKAIDFKFVLGKTDIRNY